MTIKGDDVTCERKGFTLYGHHAVISVDNDDDTNVCGCGSNSPYQVEVVDSGLNECKSEQACAKLCYYLYKSTYNLSVETFMKLCEVKIYLKDNSILSYLVKNIKFRQKSTVGDYEIILFSVFQACGKNCNIYNMYLLVCN